VQYTCRSLKIIKHTNVRSQNEIKHLSLNKIYNNLRLVIAVFNPTTATSPFDKTLFFTFSKKISFLL